MILFLGWGPLVRKGFLVLVLTAVLFPGLASAQDDFGPLDLEGRIISKITFRYRGSGSTAFLYRIDDLENEGRGRNWIFRVNGKLGQRSFALHELRPSDRVLWKFDTYR